MSLPPLVSAVSGNQEAVINTTVIISAYFAIPGQRISQLASGISGYLDIHQIKSLFSFVGPVEFPERCFLAGNG